MEKRNCMRKLVSLVVPVFNEEATVGQFLDSSQDLSQKLASMGIDLEVVFVDDGSVDSTIKNILYHKGMSFDIRIVKLSRNFRKDNALAAGFVHALGHAVVPTDVDLQDPLELIPQMATAWINGAKVVNARRVSRNQDSFAKRVSSNCFYRLFNALSSHTVEPSVGDFRLLDRQVVDILKSMPERVRFMKGLVAWVGFAPVTSDYDRPSRSAGKTKWNFWTLWNFALDGITGSTTLPLRAWTYLGVAIAFFSLFFAIFLVMRFFFVGIDVPGYTSLMVVVLFLGAMNIIAIGVLGEYVGRISIEVRQRPVYVVEDVIEVTGSVAQIGD